jgi:hypothetical protein
MRRCRSSTDPTALLLPLVGLIVGVALLGRRAIGHGIAMVGISIAIGVGGYLVTVNEDDQSGRRHLLSAEERVDRAADRAIEGGEGQTKRGVHRINRVVREAAGLSE